MTKEKPHKDFGFFKFFVDQSVFVNLMSLFVLAVGGTIAVTMIKEAFPKIDFDIMTIATPFPGATPEEVERLVTAPLERGIKLIDGIDELESYSLEGRSMIVVKLDPDHPDKQKTVREVEREVDRVRTMDLPRDGDEPLVVELKANHPIMSLAVAGNLPENKLREIARALEDDFLEIDGVGEVNRSGYRKTEIWAEADLEALRREHLSLGDLTAAVRQANHNSPGGKLEVEGQEIMVRAVGNLETAADIGAVIVRSNEEGKSVRVNDVALVSETLERRKFETRVNGKPSINLTIRKKPSGDALKIAVKVRAVVDRWRTRVPKDVAFTYSDDITFYIKRRLDVLIRNSTIGMALVLLSIFFFLSPRSAFWTALAIPFAYLGGLIVMQYCGYTINLLSLFSFILVSGMLVDDGIVISEHYERLREEGLSSVKAARVSASEMALPVTAAVLTTCIAFMPLAYVSGILGKFLRQFPLVVVATLAVDLMECLFVLPCHLAHFGKDFRLPGPFERVRSAGPRLMDRLTGLYKKPIRLLLRHPALGVLFFLVLLFGSLGVSRKFLDFDMFPIEADEIFVSFELPVGAPFDETSHKARRLEEAALRLPKMEVDAVITEIGMTGDENQQKRGTNIGQLRVLLDVTGRRKRKGELVLADIRPELERIKKEQGFEKLEIKKRGKGPPTGTAVDFRITGDQIEDLRALSREAQAFLNSLEGVYGVRDDMDEGKRELNLDVDRVAAARAGIAPAQIASVVRASFNGEIATEIKRANAEEDIEVLVKLPEADRRRKNTLRRVMVASPRGRMVPLDRLVRFKEDTGLLSIVRRDTKRSIRVFGEVNKSKSSAFQVAKALTPFLNEAVKKYPSVRWEFGGEEKDRVEALASLRKAMLVALLLIYVLLASVFQSFTQPFIIMSIVPFAFVGVFLTLLVHGLPLSMLVLIGLSGLMGVVVNNSILIVDSIKRLRESGGAGTLAEIVEEASTVRLRPILLTSFTTYFGVLPLGYGIGGREPFLEHVALTFGWGLLFTAVVTLFLVPAIYMIVDGARGWILEKSGALPAPRV